MFESVVGLLAEYSSEHEHRRVILLFQSFRWSNRKRGKKVEGGGEEEEEKKKAPVEQRRRCTSREHDSGDIDVYFIAGIIRSPKRLHQRGNYCFRFETYLLRSIAYESRNRILAFHKKFCFVRVFPLQSLSLPAISTELIRSWSLFFLLIADRGIGTLSLLCKFIFLFLIRELSRCNEKSWKNR